LTRKIELKEISLRSWPVPICVAGRLDYPHYTRPREFRGMKVPQVLFSGDHKKIDEWRRRKALEKTRERRPDLLDPNTLSEEDRRLLDRASDERNKR
jgi:tRNA (guanine37-N1)-methyltransferase